MLVLNAFTNHRHIERFTQFNCAGQQLFAMRIQHGQQRHINFQF